MKKIDGFFNYKRDLPLNESTAESIKHFNALMIHTVEHHIHCQNARYMVCGVPFHTNIIELPLVLKLLFDWKFYIQNFIKRIQISY